MALKNGLLAAAFGVLAVACAIGWTRSRDTQPANMPIAYAQPATDNAAAPQDSSSAPDAYSQDQPEPYVQVIRRPVVIRQEPPPVLESQPEPVARNYSEQPVTRVESRRHHHRSMKTSLAIVGGSAGVGAAIGAIAGGGPGAGIGAIAGGAGGFVYDRLTHNH